MKKSHHSKDARQHVPKSHKKALREHHGMNHEHGSDNHHEAWLKADLKKKQHKK